MPIYEINDNTPKKKIEIRINDKLSVIKKEKRKG